MKFEVGLGCHSDSKCSMHRISAHVTFNQDVRNNNLGRQDEYMVFDCVTEYLHVFCICVTLNQDEGNNTLRKKDARKEHYCVIRRWWAICLGVLRGILACGRLSRIYGFRAAFVDLKLSTIIESANSNFLITAECGSWECQHLKASPKKGGP